MTDYAIFSLFLCVGLIGMVYGQFLMIRELQATKTSLQALEAKSQRESPPPPQGRSPLKHLSKLWESCQKTEV